MVINHVVNQWLMNGCWSDIDIDHVVINRSVIITYHVVHDYKDIDKVLKLLDVLNTSIKYAAQLHLLH